MKKIRWIGQMLRLLITLAGAGVGALVAALVRPFLQTLYPELFNGPDSLLILYSVLCTVGAVILFAFSQQGFDLCPGGVDHLPKGWPLRFGEFAQPAKQARDQAFFAQVLRLGVQNVVRALADGDVRSGLGDCLIQLLSQCCILICWPVSGVLSL